MFRLDCLTVETLGQAEDHLLLSVVTDDGAVVPARGAWTACPGSPHEAALQRKSVRGWLSRSRSGPSHAPRNRRPDGLIYT